MVKGVNIRPPEATSPRQTLGAVGSSSSPSANKAPKPLLDESKMRPLPGAAEIAARNKPQPTSNSTEEPATAETASSAPAEKDAASMNAAKALLKDDHPGLDHLSAPPSAMQSGTASPQPEAAETEATATESAIDDAKNTGSTEGVATEASPRRGSMHRGSEVHEASVEEIRKIEKENALKEEDEEDVDDAAGIAKKVKSLEVGDAEKVQEQSAKEADDATKSVQD
jgi:hypothetical protein